MAVLHKQGRDLSTGATDTKYQYQSLRSFMLEKGKMIGGVKKEFMMAQYFDQMRSQIDYKHMYCLKEVRSYVTDLLVWEKECE
jgi:hypothetical protein